MTTAARLPVMIERGSKYTPMTKVNRHRAKSGRMQFVDEWDVCLAQFDIAYSERAFTDFAAAIDIIKTHRGKLLRFKNWYKNGFQATLVSLGTGNGVNTDFAFRTVNTAGAFTYFHPIYAPIVGSITAYVDGVAASGGDWSLIVGDADTIPLIRFVSAPADTKPVTATFQFDVPVACMTDIPAIEITSATIGRLRGITLFEVLQNPDI